MDRFEKKIHEIKKRARSELKNEKEWSHMGFAEMVRTTPDEVKIRDNVPRIDATIVSKKEFETRYENARQPVVITNALNHWPALKSWTIDKLVRKYRNQSFKCGEDDDGRSVRVKLKYFIQYMQSTQASIDDSPLYIFDSNFGENAKRKRLLNDYFIPEYFKDDLFQIASDYRRPPHRWFVMGGRRSGTNIHIDPLATSAWNALITGHKWWCMFPPECEKSQLKLEPGDGWKNRQEAVTWFSLVYPKTQTNKWPQHLKPMELLQRPGETVFVPWGWWHVVLNLDETIAVTQNYCSRANLKDVWHRTKISRPRLSENWKNRLKILRPEIYNEIAQVKFDESTEACSSSSSSSESSDSSDSDSDSCDSCSPISPSTTNDTDKDRSMKSAPGSRRSPSRKRMR